MPVALDGEAFKSALVHMADASGAVGGVPSLGVSQCYPSHELGNIAIVLWPQQHVEVVAHNAVAAQPHTHPIDPLSQDAFECRKVITLSEDTQPAVSTIKDMVNMA